MAKPPQTWYRAFPVGQTPGDWKPMKSAYAILKERGFADDPAVLCERPDDNQLGAAEKLPKGEYILQAKIRIGRKVIEVAGITFRA
jgi:hypothetical protein